MKRIPSTTLVWSFVNPWAPNQATYMPTRLAGDARIVRVSAQQFRGKAEMTVDFELNSSAYDAFEQGFTNGLIAGAGLVLQSSLWGKAIRFGGNAASVELDIALRNGVGFVETAMMSFIQLVMAVADPANPYRLELPYPQIIQEDMVEAHAEDNWVPYSEILWDRFIAENGLDGPPSN